MQQVQLSNGTTLQFPDEMSQDQIKTVIQQKFPPSNGSASSQEPSAVQKLTRPLDILHGDVKNILPNIVNLIQEGGLGLLKNAVPNPEMAKDIGAGGVGLYRNILNIPHDIPGLLEHFEMMKPETAKSIEQYLPKFEEQEWVKKLLGESKTPESKLTRALIENAPLNLAALKTAMGGVKALSKARPPAIMRKIDYEKPISLIQSKYDLRKGLNEEGFTDIENEVYKRKADRVDNVLDIVEKIEDKNYLPETEETEKLLSKAKIGDYKALRELQADLGTLGYGDRSHKLSVHRNRGKEMLSLQNKINDAIYDHLVKEGHVDLADKYKITRQEYHDIMEKFHPSGKKATPATRAISKMVGPNKIVPRNPENVFSEKSLPMDKFKEENPELVDMLEKSSKKKAQQKAAKKLKIPAAVAGSSAGVEIIKYLLGL